MTLREAQKAVGPGWRVFRATFGAGIMNYRAFRQRTNSGDSFDTVQVDYHSRRQGGEALNKLVAMVQAIDAAGAARPWGSPHE